MKGHEKELNENERTKQGIQHTNKQTHMWRNEAPCEHGVGVVAVCA